MYEYIYIYTHTHTHTHTHIYIMYVCVYRCMDIYVCTCMHVCLYTYGIFEEESYFGNAFLKLIYCDIT